jgi:RimJ/RimL family protein N-acetyltransferase
MTISRDIQLTSNRLNMLLRPPVLDDALSLHEAILVSLTELRPWMVWANEDYSIEVPTEWIMAQPESWENDTSYEFVAVDRNTQEILGGCGLNHINRAYLMANLGYWIRTDRTKEGIASEVTRLLANFGFKELGLRRIEIVTDLENKASQRVAEKAGASYEGILRNRIKSGEINSDAAMYSLIPKDM